MSLLGKGLVVQFNLVELLVLANLSTHSIQLLRHTLRLHEQTNQVETQVNQLGYKTQLLLVVV